MLLMSYVLFSPVLRFKGFFSFGLCLSLWTLLYVFGSFI